MIGIMITSLLLVQAGTSKPTEVLVGKWESTVVPAPGEAPMMPNKILITQAGTDLVLSFEGDAAPYSTTSFRGPDGKTFLIARSGGRTVVVRILRNNDIQVELFVGFPPPRSNQNFYYSETFKKAG